ncbi:hypothetical protein AWN76_012080 [Rhodothermaceae bacterium RA]|nr:hypothetical protein AWN76_012080 [Rhodothermaceae bacterium RA]
MLLKIAWRNIWRSPVRSWVVIVAIALGVWAVIFLMGFSTGMANSYVDSAIRLEVGHLQVHHPEYLTDREVQFVLPQADSVANLIAAGPGVQAVSVRTLVGGMLSSARGSHGLRVRGVDPAEEAALSQLDRKLVEGAYLPEGRRNALYLGKKLADRLGVRLRSRVVLTFQDLEGNITSAAFRVAGLFDVENNGFEEGTALARREDLNRVLGRPGAAHEIAVMLEDAALADTVATRLRNRLPGLDVQTYMQLSPEIRLFESQISASVYIIMAIVMLGLVFGIVNTMLMAVLERVRELGMLMAIGMNRPRVFGMIVLETLLLGLVGAPLGMALGAGMIRWYGRHGLDLSAYAGEGLSEFGMSAVIFPDVYPGMYVELAAAVLVTAVLGSLYPAWKAVRLRPVEALRKL